MKISAIFDCRVPTLATGWPVAAGMQCTSLHPFRVGANLPQRFLVWTIELFDIVIQSVDRTPSHLLQILEPLVGRLVDADVVQRECEHRPPGYLLDDTS